MVTIFLCAVLLGLSGAFLLGAYRLSHVENRLYQIEVFLKNSAPADSIKSLETELWQIKQFESVVYKSPDSAMADFQKRIPGGVLLLFCKNAILLKSIIMLYPAAALWPCFREKERLP